MYMGMLFGTQGASALPASNAPAADSQVAAAANSVGNAALAQAVNVTNAAGITNNAKVNVNKPALTNLGNILNTPSAPTVGGRRK
jgi:hypothetical protein